MSDGKTDTRNATMTFSTTFRFLAIALCATFLACPLAGAAPKAKPEMKCQELPNVYKIILKGKLPGGVDKAVGTVTDTAGNTVTTEFRQDGDYLVSVDWFYNRKPNEKMKDVYVIPQQVDLIVDGKKLEGTTKPKSAGELVYILVGSHQKMSHSVEISDAATGKEVFALGQEPIEAVKIKEDGKQNLIVFGGSGAYPTLVVDAHYGTNSTYVTPVPWTKMITDPDSGRLTASPVVMTIVRELKKDLIKAYWWVTPFGKDAAGAQIVAHWSTPFKPDPALGGSLVTKPKGKDGALRPCEKNSVTFRALPADADGYQVHEKDAVVPRMLEVRSMADPKYRPIAIKWYAFFNPVKTQRRLEGRWTFNYYQYWATEHPDQICDFSNTPPNAGLPAADSAYVRGRATAPTIPNVDPNGMALGVFFHAGSNRGHINIYMSNIAKYKSRERKFPESDLPATKPKWYKDLLIKSWNWTVVHRTNLVNVTVAH